MTLRLKKCCFLLPLGRGCLIMSLILLFIEIIGPPLPDMGPWGSKKYILFVAYKLFNMIHTLGCLVLLASYFVRFSIFVLVFLITAMVHIVGLPIFLYLETYFWDIDYIDRLIAAVGELLTIYFWIMTYFYYLECKDEIIRKKTEHVMFAPHIP